MTLKQSFWLNVKMWCPKMNTRFNNASANTACSAILEKKKSSYRNGLQPLLHVQYINSLVNLGIHWYWGKVIKYQYLDYCTRFMRLRLYRRTPKYSEQLWNPDKDTCRHDNLMFTVTPARKETPSCSWPAPSWGQALVSPWTSTCPRALTTCQPGGPRSPPVLSNA